MGRFMKMIATIGVSAVIVVISGFIVVITKTLLDVKKQLHDVSFLKDRFDHRDQD